MGVVYKAWQVSLDKPVALKMILGGYFVGQEAVNRFRNEAQAAASLSHDNIVKVHEIGEHEGRFYFTMEFIEGTNLLAKLKDKEWKLRNRVTLLKQVAEAVGHAHQRTIIHRDLKPANILVDPQGRPYVTDFGLARRVAGDGNQTETGIPIGTPNYMPPEQVLGLSGQITTAVDVWALGVLLYELLTDQLPFQAPSNEEIYRRIREEQPRRPRSISARADRDLETICLRCLDKNHARRPSAPALARHLQDWLDGRPLRELRPYPFWELLVMWAKRKPAIAALSVTVALAALLGSAGIIWKWQEAEQKAISLAKALEDIQLQRAEASFEADEASAGLAYLAHVLRTNPANRVAAERILSALTHRNFLLPILELKHRDVLNVTLSDPTGSKLLVVSNSVARVLDALTGRLLGTLEQKGHQICSAQFSPNGHELVTSSGNLPWAGGTVSNATLCLWDADEGKLKKGPSPDLKIPWVMSPANKTGFPGAWKEHLEVWDPDADIKCAPYGRSDSIAGLPRSPPVGIAGLPAYQRPPPDIPNAGDWVSVNALSPDRQRNAQVSYGGALRARPTTIRILDVHGQPVAEPIKDRRLVFHNPQFSPDSCRVFICSGEGWGILPDTLRIWEARNGQGFAEICDLSESLHVSKGDTTWFLSHFNDGDGSPQLRLSSNASSVLVATVLGGIAMVDWRSGAIASGPASLLDCMAAEFSGNDRSMTTSTTTWSGTNSCASTISIWNNNWERQSSFSFAEPVYSVCVSSNRERVLTRSGYLPSNPPEPGVRVIRATNVCLWNVKTGGLVFPPLRPGGKIACATLSPDGTCFVTASDDQTAKVWDAASGKFRGIELRHAGTVWAAQFSPDGRYIVTASGDGSASLWDVRTGRAMGRPMRHQASVSFAQFSSDSRRVVTISDDKTARIWDTATGQPLTEPLKHPRAIDLAEFISHGQQLLTIAGGFARVWDIRTTNAPVEGWFLDLVEAVAGQRVYQAGLLEDVPIAQLLKSKQDVLTSPAMDFYTHWAKWFFADRSTRTISPFSTNTVPAVVASLIQKNTAASLDEAERLAYGSAELLARISKVRDALGTRNAGKLVAPF